MYTHPAVSHEDFGKGKPLAYGKNCVVWFNNDKQ